MKQTINIINNIGGEPQGQKPSEKIQQLGNHNLTHIGEKCSIVTTQNPETGQNKYTVIYPDSNKLITHDPDKAIQFAKGQLGNFGDDEVFIESSGEPNPIPERVEPQQPFRNDSMKMKNRVRLVDGKDFDESKVKRANNGQFSSTGGEGGSTAGKTPVKSKAQRQAGARGEKPQSKEKTKVNSGTLGKHLTKKLGNYGHKMETTSNGVELGTDILESPGLNSKVLTMISNGLKPDQIGALKEAGFVVEAPSAETSNFAQEIGNFDFPEGSMVIYPEGEPVEGRYPSVDPEKVKSIIEGTGR